MEVDHLINEKQINLLKTTCVYCSNRLDLKKWKHYCEGPYCYKTNDCSECGRTNTVRVDIGSGHDDWNKIPSETIDDRLKEPNNPKRS